MPISLVSSADNIGADQSSLKSSDLYRVSLSQDKAFAVPLITLPVM